MRTHKCHAVACPVAVRPAKLFCLYHWKMLSWAARDRVLRTYRPGQEKDKRPSKAYCDAAREAVIEVAVTENRSLTGRENELRAFALVDPTTNSGGES